MTAAEDSTGQPFAPGAASNRETGSTAKPEADYLLGVIHIFMKSTLIDLARKWGVGVCLLLWCWLSYLVMGVPAMLILLLIYCGVSIAIVKVALGAYAVICIPLLAYELGRAFGLRYDKVPTK